MPSLPEEVREVLKHDGAAAIMTLGEDGPHLVGTWQSYIEMDGNSLVIPAGGYHVTQRNVEAGSKVVLLIGGEQNEAPKGHNGTGFRLEGSGSFITEGPVWERTREQFPWARAAFVIRVVDWERLV